MTVSVPPPTPPSAETQSAPAVLMVRPARFGFNADTAPSNAFQKGAGFAAGETQRLALGEFDAVARALERSGVSVIVVEDTVQPHKPDAVFPNNWVSFHADGTVVLYPMLAPNRRPERREEIIARVLREGGFGASRTVDLSNREQEHKFLEGTGSLALDRLQGVAYANLSPRTHLDVLGDFAQQLDYDLVTFESADEAGRAVYHTNVMLAIGSDFAVICAESIANLPNRLAVRSKLESSGREIIEITRAQMQAFAGNLVELAPPGSRVIALSASAWRSLDPGQRLGLERHGQLVVTEIPVIERCGGGSVRCMLAEIHLPRRMPAGLP